MTSGKLVSFLPIHGVIENDEKATQIYRWESIENLFRNFYSLKLVHWH